MRERVDENSGRAGGGKLNKLREERDMEIQRNREKRRIKQK